MFRTCVVCSCFGIPVAVSFLVVEHGNVVVLAPTWAGIC